MSEQLSIYNICDWSDSYRQSTLFGIGLKSAPRWRYGAVRLALTQWRCGSNSTTAFGVYHFTCRCKTWRWRLEGRLINNAWCRINCITQSGHARITSACRQENPHANIPHPVTGGVWQGMFLSCLLFFCPFAVYCFMDRQPTKLQHWATVPLIIILNLWSLV